MAQVSHDANFSTASVDLVAALIETAVIDFFKFLKWMVQVPTFWFNQIVEEIDLWMHNTFSK